MHLLAWITALIFVAINFLPFSLSDPRISEARFLCSLERPPANASASYIPLFVSGMEVLSQRVTANEWGSYAVNSTNTSIYTLAQCHADLSRDDCLQCYAASRTRLPRCLPAAGGRIFLDGCFLRYDSYAFFNESVDPDSDAVNCNSTAPNSTLPEAEFRRRVVEVIDNVTAGAGRFAAVGIGGAFGLAECWNTVGAEGCKACLAKANSEIRRCLPSSEGRALNAGCYLRYSTQKFFSNQSDASNRDSGVSRRGVIVAIAFSVVAFCMLCLFGGHAAYRRWNRRKQERYNLGKISYSYNKSSLNYKYETLEKATDYFDPSRKLGQGGAGSVYRGTLPDGKTVAVKRLFFSTRQWVDEFFNEVNLISGIEHKNLVKLLGCSIEGPESLLVYEYVPNQSLEVCLFDKNRAKILNWKERYNVVVGTAEGIAFLHGGTEFRIIHRDIKSSNVLLDENLDAKIADFGLARNFAADKTHLSTGIAGTLGYMAPEYIVKGQLTEKADVYSYGVLVLEIVCGRKNNAFVEDSGSLLQTVISPPVVIIFITLFHLVHFHKHRFVQVWKLFKTDRLAESVDPSLEGDFPPTEASKVLKIGLLCAQASMAQRPSMADVVRMLTDENCEIPEPKQPPFLNTSALSGSTTRSSYSNSFTSNPMTRPETSYPTTESFSIQSSEGRQSTSEETRLK
ncbi:cysteine-rich receptor-like protein kinase 42 isoform X2 [Salvia miltiorrhiza]|uniref:cysteine-rich receptor-like protein kinase 42 isoform X2 n=1 Tax=Salvia miltiorrhiza TaxID=226208 RepID=UPI0025AD832E|nr:cysteine-rich receptor-like protein kinase 42 isoform X2 [Salvia miltiorrhiza]